MVQEVPGRLEQTIDTDASDRGPSPGRQRMARPMVRIGRRTASLAGYPSDLTMRYRDSAWSVLASAGL